jgi:glycosyltransferase involved in cell wall biosynthesis
VNAHVLVLVEALPYPMDVRIRAQVDALRTAGYAVTVACPTGDGYEARDETLDGVRVLRYRAPPGGRGALGYLREYAAAAVGLARLVVRAERERPVDLVFVCSPPDALVALALPLVRRGARVLFDYREISPELFAAKFGRGGLVGPLLHRLLLVSERFAFRHSDVVITVSEPDIELARTRGGVPANRIFLVGNGPDARRIFPVELRAELRRGRDHLVLWLGSMSSQEGLERLLEAADHIIHGLARRDVAFSIIGPGDAHTALRRRVRRLGLQDAVEVGGAVGDDLVRAYLSTADVCVGVDERNDMNDRAAMRKVLEYMAVGRPVVQFPLAEMRRLCGDSTVYARNADPIDLARAIVGLLDEPERRARLGAEARRRAFAGLMWHQQVETLIQAVETALAAPRRRPPQRVIGGRRLSYALRAARAIAADPTEGIERVRERLGERFQASADGLYAPDPDWRRQLHQILGAPWPCPAAEEFAAPWSRATEALRRQGLAPGRGAYGGWDDADAALAEAAWCLMRHLRPRRVVETGVARGMTTRCLLEALELNGDGRLWSIDLPPLIERGLQDETAAAVGTHPRGRWTLVRGSSRRRLPALLAGLDPIDLFVHDSMHTERNVRFELERVWPALRPGGFALVDDVDQGRGLHLFAGGVGGAQTLVCPSDDGRGLFAVIRKDERRS